MSLDKFNTGMSLGVPIPPLNTKVDGEGLPRPNAWEASSPDAGAQTRDEIRQLSAELRRSLDALPDKLDTIIYQTVAPSLQSLSLIISGLEGRFEGLENAVVQLEAQTGGAMQVHLGALGMRLDGVLRSQEQMGKEVHALFAAVSQQANEETDLLVETLNARFNGMVNLLTRLEDRVTALEQVATEISMMHNHHTTSQAQVLDERLSRLEAILISGMSAGTIVDKDDKARPWWKRNVSASSSPSSAPPAPIAASEAEAVPQVVEVWDENARKVRTATSDIMPRPPKRS